MNSQLSTILSKSSLFPFLIILSLLATANVHAVYLATVSVVHGSENQVKVEVKVFADDLQDVIRNFDESFTPSELASLLEANRALVESYFQKNLELQLNGTPVEFFLRTGELQNDAYVLSFESARPVAEWKQLRVLGDFFTEVFPDQTNVLIVSYDGKRQFARLNQSERSSTFTFD